MYSTTTCGRRGNEPQARTSSFDLHLRLRTEHVHVVASHTQAGLTGPPQPFPSMQTAIRPH